jgi:hypothetical protein
MGGALQTVGVANSANQLSRLHRSPTRRRQQLRSIRELPIQGSIHGNQSAIAKGAPLIPDLITLT